MDVRAKKTGEGHFLHGIKFSGAVNRKERTVKKNGTLPAHSSGPGQTFNKS